MFLLVAPKRQDLFTSCGEGSTRFIYRPWRLPQPTSVELSGLGGYRDFVTPPLPLAPLSSRRVLEAVTKSSPPAWRWICDPGPATPADL